MQLRGDPACFVVHHLLAVALEMVNLNLTLGLASAVTVLLVGLRRFHSFVQNLIVHLLKAVREYGLKIK